MGVAGDQRIEGPGHRFDPVGQGPGALPELEGQTDPAQLGAGDDPGDVRVEGGPALVDAPEGDGGTHHLGPRPGGQDAVAAVGQRPKHLHGDGVALPVPDGVDDPVELDELVDLVNFIDGHAGTHRRRERQVGCSRLRLRHPGRTTERRVVRRSMTCRRTSTPSPGPVGTRSRPSCRTKGAVMSSWK